MEYAIIAMFFLGVGLFFGSRRTKPSLINVSTPEELAKVLDKFSDRFLLSSVRKGGMTAPDALQMLLIVQASVLSKRVVTTELTLKMNLNEFIYDNIGTHLHEYRKEATKKYGMSFGKTGTEGGDDSGPTTH